MGNLVIAGRVFGIETQILSNCYKEFIIPFLKIVYFFGIFTH